MNHSLKEISQISIYLKKEAERINEVALLQPLSRASQFNEEERPIAQRRWTYTSNLSLFHRLSLKFQSFVFKHLPSLIPAERLTAEAKFKTVLALLLAQEGVRDFFLSDGTRLHDFFSALQEAAQTCGYTSFSSLISYPAGSDSLKISRYLTTLEGHKESLIDNLMELNLQMAALDPKERREILFRILNRIERPPITSVVEITSPHAIHSITLTTQYAKYKIFHYDPTTGKFTYSFEENHATPSIRTHQNALPNAKGAINQRVVKNGGADIGSYCGELSTPFHVLEQILLILGIGPHEEECMLLDQIPQGVITEKKKILFTSLFSWSELDQISDQWAAIRKWDQKVLKCNNKYYHLDLLYYNIPFNALNKYPTPGEVHATLQDINDEALIILISESWNHLQLESDELRALAARLESLRTLGEESFLEREKALLEEIDRFRRLKRDLLTQLTPLTPFTLALKAILSEEKPNGRKLKGIDKLLYLDYIATQLGYFHNKNCQNATDRSAGADAADKAQYGYCMLFNRPYLPGSDNEEERALFQVLYSMYLVWEEPEINTALSTGFMGEKFYNNFLQKNPETTRYLVHWLKKNPEMYLGLSDYRM